MATLPQEEPPPLPPPEPNVALAEAPLPAQIAIASPTGAGRLDLTSAWTLGTDIRRQIRWRSASDIMVAHNGRELRSSVVTSIDAIVQLTVTAVDKGAVQTMEVHFESMDRESSGAAAELAGDPEVGSTWSCRVDTQPVLCSVSSERIEAPPDWLTLTFAPLLPARAVEPGEVWSRRAGVAMAVGVGGDGTLRATVQAEAPYETAEGLFSTARFEFEGEDMTQAFGRTAALTLAGQGAFEFDLHTHRITDFDARWSGRSEGQRNNEAAHSRVTETSIRVTELAQTEP